MPERGGEGVGGLSGDDGDNDDAEFEIWESSEEGTLEEGGEIAISRREISSRAATSEEGGEVDPPEERGPSARSIGREESSVGATAAASSTAAPRSPDGSLAHPNGGQPAQSSWANARPLLFGIFMGQIGMVL
jgi:hypothetical protein